MDVPQPTSDPVGLTITQRPLINSSVVGRKRNLSTTKNPSQISKRARLALNISTASTYVTPRRLLTSTRLFTRGFVFCRSTSGSHSPGIIVTRDANAPVLHVTGILNNAGLMSLELTRTETICAEETGIGWLTFCQTFGGRKRSEWPKCSRKSGYEDFLCADVTVQPFVPLDYGKPGLVLQLPAVTESSRNDKSTFHVFTTMPQGGTLYYRGKYAKIPVPQLQFKWENLPREVCMQKFTTHVSYITSSRNVGSDGRSCLPCVLFELALHLGIYRSASLQLQRSRNTPDSISKIK
jgi:hypothetical protein